MNSDVLTELRSIDFKALGRWRKEALGLLVLAAFTLFFYKFMYLSNARELSSIDVEINSARMEIARINNEVRSAESLKKEAERAAQELKSLESTLSALRERLPAERQVSRILAELTEKEKGVRIAAVKPLAPEEKGELVRLPFNLTIEGRYAAIGDYLETLERQPRLMVVDNFILEQKKEGSAVLTSQIYLSAYVLKSGK